MVTAYRKSEIRKDPAPRAVEAVCSGLDIAGNGVCRINDAVYFTENLLPGEKARIIADSTQTGKKAVFKATVTKYIETSPERMTATCPLQKECGGCPLSHMKDETALQAKTEGVSQLLRASVLKATAESMKKRPSKSIGVSVLSKNSTIKQVLAQKKAKAGNDAAMEKIKAAACDAALVTQKPDFVISSASLAYRRACRLAVRADHGKLRLGFRSAGSQKLVPVSFCECLTDRLNKLLEPAQKVINTLEGSRNIGHVELLDSDGAAALLLRVTKRMSDEDCEKLILFGRENNVVVFLLESAKQIDDSDTVRERVLNPETGDVFIMSGGVRLDCSPSSFVQINAAVNAAMIDKLLEIIQPHENMKVLDLFCGLGNLSFPLMKRGAEVFGVDIVADMVNRANAVIESSKGALKGNFSVLDLEGELYYGNQVWANADYDVVVMDPGRTGARKAVDLIVNRSSKPKMLLMISCNPTAAARDCAALIEGGFRLEKWGVLDMFPKTSHIEVMTVYSYSGK